jgi:hypothetical protein
MSISQRWLAIGLLATSCSFAYGASNEATTETATLDGRTFQTDLGRITTLRLHLHDGDFRIVGSDSDEITIQTDGKNQALAKKMKVHLERTGDSLNITFSNVPKNECQVTIAVPKETNLFARMRAGDLSVDGVSGDKDLELTGGDMSIQVADPAAYGPVDLKVRFGDVSGSQFGDPKGWLGNSLRRDGSGKYRLHAHVFAGDLTLRP